MFLFAEHQMERTKYSIIVKSTIAFLNLFVFLTVNDFVGPVFVLTEDIDQVNIQ